MPVNEANLLKRFAKEIISLHNSQEDSDGRFLCRCSLCNAAREVMKKSPSQDHIAGLEKFMLEVSTRLKCLPDYTRPAPNEGNTHVMAALENLQRSNAYYKALAQHPRKAPPYVPARVKLLIKIYRNGPESPVLLEPGEYDCASSTSGAVAIPTIEGQYSQAIGVVEGEFEVISWRENEHCSQQEG